MDEYYEIHHTHVNMMNESYLLLLIQGNNNNKSNIVNTDDVDTYLGLKLVLKSMSNTIFEQAKDLIKVI